MRSKGIAAPSRGARAVRALVAGGFVAATLAACSTTSGGGTVDAGDASSCVEGSYVCDRIGEGRICSSGQWVTVFDGPCGPNVEPPKPDAARPDASTDAARPDASADAADASDAGDCPADLGGALGTACSPEGKFCGSCGDPCKFCNIIRCELGKWGRIEVPPMPCDSGGGG